MMHTPLASGLYVRKSSAKHKIEFAPVMFLGDATAAEIDSVDENRAQVHKGIVNIIDLTIWADVGPSREIDFPGPESVAKAVE
jgi:hypothetical protein